MSEDLKSIIEKEKTLLPNEKYFKILFILIMLTIFQFIKGGKGMNSILGIEPCGYLYQLVNIIMFFICICIVKRYSIEVKIFLITLKLITYR